MPHHVKSGDNPDLTKERKAATFNAEDLSAFLYGSKEKVERRREISRIVASDPDFSNTPPLEFIDREKRIDVQAKKTRRLLGKIHELIDFTNDDERELLFTEVFVSDGFPIFLHFAMFLPVLQGQAHEEMADEWLSKAMNIEIIGTYAQTEMGHGTNLKELETIATYDKQNEEFVLHTPTRSATKWWPGNLGKMANYAIVTAQLHIDGKSYGPHNFFVQLRSENDHRPMAGITVGDIGPKMGANGIDNGFLALDRVRIPRTRMLMKYVKVAPDGTYTPPLHSKVNYGGMVHVRAHMVTSMATYLSMAATIATRYSAIRRQGRIEPNLPEVQVIDYQTQQYRLFPQIARAYACLLSGSEVEDLYKKTVQGLNRGEADLLPDLHALTSALKSVCSFSCATAVEQCRMACGGHGYSMASGIPNLYTFAIAGCTYEGENMVMLQQAARYLMKSLDKTARGEPLSYSVEFLGKKMETRSNVGLHKNNQKEEIEALLCSFEHIATRLTVVASQKLQNRMKMGESKERAWNGATVEMNKAARVYARLFIARSFARRVASSPASVRPVLTDLLSLYLHYECVDMTHHLLHDGYCNGEQIEYLKQRIYDDLAKIRPNAVALVDAFDHSDRLLNSVLGRRDGNVYEALFQWAKASELNYTDVLPAFDHIKQMMEENRAKI
ncbi:hypothetical protein PMAYCL1PPCAC_21806 [Pristionchus mayeri]|uniref:Acyl-coenzyme A oxidase n=1 Tax=Pristionchus mayeri TaxID=1317129 RepID=A0AAN5CVU6_9BILA|nr:hypothetical protein PMAYCL1PPCAC_21806 [Pristionchus mayeri]